MHTYIPFTCTHVNMYIAYTNTHTDTLSCSFIVWRYHALPLPDSTKGRTIIYSVCRERKVIRFSQKHSAAVFLHRWNSTTTRDLGTKKLEMYILIKSFLFIIIFFIWQITTDHYKSFWYHLKTIFAFLSVVKRSERPFQVQISVNKLPMFPA